MSENQKKPINPAVFFLKTIGIFYFSAIGISLIKVVLNSVFPLIFSIVQELQMAEELRIEMVATGSFLALFAIVPLLLSFIILKILWKIVKSMVKDISDRVQPKAQENEEDYSFTLTDAKGKTTSWDDSGNLSSSSPPVQQSTKYSSLSDLDKPTGFFQNLFVRKDDSGFSENSSKPRPSQATAEQKEAPQETQQEQPPETKDGTKIAKKIIIGIFLFQFLTVVLPLIIGMIIMFFA